MEHITTYKENTSNLKPWATLRGAFFRLWYLKRLHLFEFCDQPWLKGFWREAYMDGLNTSFKMFKIHHGLFKPFCEWVDAAKKKNVLEVCSGGGGPMDSIVTRAKENGKPIPFITLSDLNPDINAFKKTKEKHPEHINYIKEPVDAANTESLNAELISLCSSFHHLSPKIAGKILSNASKNSNGIFIREVLSRNILNAASSLLNIIPLMLTPFFSGRTSLLKVLFTTIIPIIPLMIIFDGIVSVFRTYTTDEIIHMMPDEMKRNWEWVEGGNSIMGIFHAPYLYGYKK